MRHLASRRSRNLLRQSSGAVKPMQRALATAKRGRIHSSMQFAATEDLLRRVLLGAPGARELSVGFARFIGSTFPVMPRPDVTYYPVLALFYLPAGRRYRTFDQYQLEAGTTALVYPVFRSWKSSVQALLLEQAVPAARAWLEDCFGGDQPTSFYVLHDQTFDEIAFGINVIAGHNAGSRLRLAERSRVVVSLRSGVAGLP
jgi:hypothetical protein